jgi:rhodanese-related sulfurtransferase
MSYTQILYPRLRELLDRDAQLVEVLPPGEYNELHLPGAINIPLKTLDAESPLTWIVPGRSSCIAGTASET